MPEGIALAFSGGVDSTIAAIQLARGGHEVHAVYFRMWKWRGEQYDHSEIEKRAAEISKLAPLHFASIDASQAMEGIVIDDFRRQLAAGLTPSPCVRCNPLLKFRLLEEYANNHGLQKIATGHYAQVKRVNEEYTGLFQAVDLSKDQSYMLCYLNQAILSRTVFPLGATEKKENKRIAKELGLSISEQPESQDLCFLNHYDYEEFLQQASPEILIPGEITDSAGKLLGKHNGLALYTIGQRKGIRIASKEAYYVISKDVPKNRLVVGYLEELGKSQMVVEQVNWISGKDVVNLKCDVKIRYRAKSVPCKISKKDGSFTYLVQFGQKMRDITPGQFAVFYRDDEVLGGGMIARAE